MSSMTSIFSKTIIVLLALSTLCYGAGWGVEIKFLKDHVIPAEPIYVKIVIMNNSAKQLPALQFEYYSLDGKQCYSCLLGSPNPDQSENSDSSEIEIKPFLKPAGYQEIEIYSINCACNVRWDKFSYGEHKFCSHWKNDVKACAKFYFEKPFGVDAEAFKIIQEESFTKFGNYEEFVVLDVTSKTFNHLLKKFPGSIYTAWTYFHRMYDPTKIEAHYTVVDLRKSNYPPRGIYIPESEAYEGYGLNTHLNSGIESAKWIKEKSELILSHHPDFPFANKLRIQIALSNIALGIEKKGILQLQTFFKQSTEKKVLSKKPLETEAEWAEKFLALWAKERL
ncbi:MAG: hypothetical protein A2Y62_01225 [Candidatus Fischerbacteria bacterium RBG_13_37_8]|uniref:Uncharacterized protein n=1 Tax=Candidatus Fischerbacteria bacterium RBG_13_37_8 TaxID=1817863 RepID=A0A1F5VX66_9BACT|nr:MAG: hypothetical protein A2Y62_01225 [Candidatus Fischerbacteria bacterium RBG_13_37_8]